MFADPKTSGSVLFLSLVSILTASVSTQPTVHRQSANSRSLNEDASSVSRSETLRNPNYMILPDIVVLLGDTATGELCVENSDPFVSFQCDIILPGGTEYIDGSAELTDRAVDHSLAASLIPPNTLRLLAYSLSQAEFLGDSGAVATFDIEASGPVGTYPMTLENTILGDSNSQNILTGVVNGEVIILPNPLAVIDDLSVEVVGANVQLNWTAPTWTAGYYRVYRSTQPFFDTNSAESEFSFTGPTSGQVTWTDTNAAGTYEQSFYIVTHSTEP